jgi:hypothetical protein
MRSLVIGRSTVIAGFLWQPMMRKPRSIELKRVYADLVFENTAIKDMPSRKP